MLSPIGHTEKVPIDSRNIEFYVLNWALMILNEAIIAARPDWSRLARSEILHSVVRIISRRVRKVVVSNGFDSRSRRRD